MSEDQPIVVIIDDDPDIRDALKDLLETVDLPAVLFATASEFLASKRPQGPCCIVADVRLPGLSGLDFQQELARENNPTPVTFSTSRLSLRPSPSTRCRRVPSRPSATMAKSGRHLPRMEAIARRF
jgi:FixJ family two-component response regulator